MKENNIILMTDSYKLSHWPQYPNGMLKVYSYMEAREGSKFPYTLWMGLQGIIREYMEGVVVTQQMLDDATVFAKAHFGRDIFNREGWQHIIDKHGGKLPLEIKAVKEGSLVPISNVLMTIENTDPECYWLTNVMETLLMKVWHPVTVATNSFTAKIAIKHFLKETGCSLDGLAFKLHDFGYRGVSSEESARIGGAAHLVNFMGTDTLGAITYLQDHYSDGDRSKMYGFSVPASEHSVATSYTEFGEEEYFLKMLDTYPEGIVSIVSDTYDLFNFVETMSRKYKKKIIQRNGTVVFRPDSGDPVAVNMKLINILWKIFGGEFTETGHKLLDSHVRIIQGDGIDLDSLMEILSTAESNGFAADNWVFGSGGGLLQKFNRDTQRFAIKASYGEKKVGDDIVQFSFKKNPKTDSSKGSKAGRLKLTPIGATGFATISSFETTEPMFNGYVDSLETVFRDGEVTRFQTIEEIREIADGFFQTANEEYQIIPTEVNEEEYEHSQSDR